ncbi:hypothetical protein ACIQLJ_15575 [Microbacterium sp. NPDC091313]
MRRTWTIGMLAGAALVMSGCAVPPGVPQARETAEPVDAVVCAPQPGGEADGVPSRGLVPDRFDPVAVIRCDESGTEEDEAGVWAGTAIVRLEGDVARFVATMSAPSDPPSNGPCTADMVFVPDVWAASADGRFVRLSHPITGCGKPKVDVQAELARLQETARSFSRTTLIESRAATEAGCATRAGVLRLAGAEDVVAPPSGPIEVDPKPVDPGGAALIPYEPPLPDAADVDGIRLCAYENALPAPEAVPSPVGDGGVFVGAVERDAETARAVLALAASAEPASPGCRLTASRFVTATFLPESAQASAATLTVELDGCRALVTSGLQMLVAPPELAALVTP